MSQYDKQLFGYSHFGGCWNCWHKVNFWVTFVVDGRSHQNWEYTRQPNFLRTDKENSKKSFFLNALYQRNFNGKFFRWQHQRNPYALTAQIPYMPKGLMDFFVRAILAWGRVMPGKRAPLTKIWRPYQKQICHNFLNIAYKPASRHRLWLPYILWTLWTWGFTWQHPIYTTPFTKIE